jgi:hypothetical protein
VIAIVKILKELIKMLMIILKMRKAIRIMKRKRNIMIIVQRKGTKNIRERIFRKVMMK